MVEVDPNDPAFQNPTKFVGPVYEKEVAEKLAAEKGWTIKQDGNMWRRVVPSPLPKRIFEHRPIKWLLEQGAIVICAGGGGIPTMYDPSHERLLVGVEAVIDKDWCTALLAREIEADLYLMATDVDGVYLDWGTPEARKIDRATPDELETYDFAAGSMGPKVAEPPAPLPGSTGNRAAIGSHWPISKPSSPEKPARLQEPAPMSRKGEKCLNLAYILKLENCVRSLFIDLDLKCGA